MAGRYATALFELARESNAIDRVQSDLKFFDALIADNSDLKRLVRSPVFAADEQAKALGAVLEKAGISGIAANFLRVVTSNRRLFAVRDMIRGFNKLVAAHKGEVTAQVTVAEQKKKKQKKNKQTTIKEKTRKDEQVDVTIKTKKNKELKVKLGSRMVDASLRTKL